MTRYFRVTKRCQFCGKEFGIIASIAKKGGGRFCSDLCRNKDPIFRKEMSKLMHDVSTNSWKDPRRQERHAKMMLDNTFGRGWFHKEQIIRYNKDTKIYRHSSNGRFVSLPNGVLRRRGDN